MRRQTVQVRLHPDGVAAPEFLDAKQATKVVEGLKAWLIRVRARAAAGMIASGSGASWSWVGGGGDDAGVSSAGCDPIEDDEQ